MKTFRITVLALVVTAFATFSLAQPAPRPTDDAMATWSAGGLLFIEAITEDIEAINTEDLPAMLRGCRALKVDAQRFRAYRPSPNRAMNVQVAGGLDDFTKAADHCVRGVQGRDAASMQEAAEYLESGTLKLSGVAGMMDTYIGKR